MNELLIRTAGGSDAALLAELGTSTFIESYPTVPVERLRAYCATAFARERIAAELDDPRRVVFVAERDGRPAGYAALREGEPAPTRPDPIELTRIYVAMDHLGAGVGAALMRACIEEAARRGCATIWLAVWAENRRAIAFYEGWGFEATGSQLFDMAGDIQSDVVMARPVG